MNPDEAAEPSENDSMRSPRGQGIASPAASMPCVAVGSPHLARRIGGHVDGG